MKTTAAFKKRFHGLSLKDKITTAALVREVVASGKMPSGNKLQGEDLQAMKELCAWCDENIFFNKMPNGKYADHVYGIKE